MFPIPKSKDKNNWNNEYPVHQVAGQINVNFVCVDCRFTRRAANGAEGIVCPHCSLPMISFGCKMRLPSKTNDRAWKELKRGHR